MGSPAPAQQARLAHFGPLARGVQSRHTGGWFFSGRHQALTEIVAWIRDGKGILMVTGWPGSGKSAVLARVVTFADAAYLATVPQEVRDAAPPETVPSGGSVHAAVLASGKTTAAVAAELAAILGAAVGETGLDAVVDVILRRAEPTVIVIDALDEAVDPEHLIGELVNKLPEEVRPHRIRLIVGVRHTYSARVRAKETIDLDRGRFFRQEDVTDYVNSFLLGHDDSPYRGSPAEAAPLAAAVARSAGPSFLIAHLLAIDLIDGGAPGNGGTFPSTVGDALERLLRRIADALAAEHGDPPSQWRGWLRGLLTALAVAEGGQLRDDLWVRFATRLGAQVYALQDLNLLRKTRAGDLLQARGAETGLFHRALAGHLRGEAPVDVNTIITDLLLEEVPLDPGGAAQWGSADPYVRDTIASYAALGGRLDDLVGDLRFLTHVAPARLLPMLPALTTDEGRAIAEVYQLAAHRLSDAAPADAATALSLTAKLGKHEKLAAAFAAVAGRRIEPLWAAWQAISPHLRLPGHTSAVTAVAVARIGGKSVVIAGGADGKVLTWDVETGQASFPVGPSGGPVAALGVRGGEIAIGTQGDDIVHVTELDTGRTLEPAIPALAAIGTRDGGWAAVSGGEEARLWYLADPDGSPDGSPDGNRDEPLGIGRALALSIDELPYGTVVSAAEGKTIKLLRVDDGFRYDRLRDVPEGDITAISAVMEGDELIVLTGHENRAVRFWTRRLRSLGPPLAGHTGRVLSIAGGTRAGGTSFIVTGGEDGTVRLWDIHRDPLADAGQPQAVIDHDAVAIGVVAGIPLAVTMDGAKTLRRRSLSDGLQLGPDIASPQRGRLAVGRYRDVDVVAVTTLNEVALHPFAGSPIAPLRQSVLAVGALDGTLVAAKATGPGGRFKLVDLASGDDLSGAFEPGRLPTAIAVARLGGSDLIAYAVPDGRIFVHEIGNGAPFGRTTLPGGLIQAPGEVAALSLGLLDDEPAIAYAGPNLPVSVVSIGTDEEFSFDLGSPVTDLAFGPRGELVITSSSGVACVKLNPAPAGDKGT
ncbi:AAA family ATPase [Spirillospora sp. CA-142024]|uniref:AAA family ATPase n=1 Tax=Spirillospora sp. CA-142024 TaxID=3240036 RepID=UPI003D8E3B49